MKRRWLAAGVTLMLLLTASAVAVAHHSPGHDGGPPGTQEPSDDGALEDPDDGTVDDSNADEPQPPQGPLLTNYSFTDGQEGNFAYIESGFVNGLQQDAPHGTRTIMDTGPYEGWDVLLTDQGWDVRYLATDNWITLELSRDATVGIVWQADEPVPAWLNEWTYVGDNVVIEDSQSPKPRSVFERDFGPGDVVLGGVYSEGEDGDQRSPYVVVLNDGDAVTPPEDDNDSHDDDGHSDDGHNDDGHHDDGHSGAEPGDGKYVDDVDEWLYGTHHWSVEPLSVVDTDALDQPVEGEACPKWTSRNHVTQGRDGMYYLSWHPTVDPDYGCYYSYEHGSNPARVPGANMPSFAYGTPMHAKESEYGFKVKAFDFGSYANQPNTLLLATTHFGTAEPHIAVCQRYHWNNFQFTVDGELVADLTFMGDFGSARKNDTNEPLDPNNLHQCVDPFDGQMRTQAEIMAISHGVRLNPTCTGPENNDCSPFYYPWRVDGRTVGPVLGMRVMDYTVNTPTVMAACEDMACLESRHIGGHGAWAFADFRDNFGVSDPGHSSDGIFYTNALGTEIVSADTPGSIQQYVKPGTDISIHNPSDQSSMFPDATADPQIVGDYLFRRLYNGDPNIAHNHRAAVDPHGYIQGKN
jgi:hypothetical protein